MSRTAVTSFWAKNVVDGFTEPNPILKAEFQRTFEQFNMFGNE